MNPKIINVSLPRTGTQSLYSFALAKGFSSKHFLSPDEDKYFQTTDRKIAASKYLDIIKNFEVIGDTPIFYFLDEIVKTNIDATYVLIKRSPKSWANSIISNMEASRKITNEWPNYWASALFDDYVIIDYSKGNISIDELTKVHAGYHERLDDIFKKYKINPIRLKLEEDLSVDLNKIFDETRKTDFIEFPSVDFLKDIIV